MEDNELKFLQELLNPRFDLIEQHFKHPVPKLLRDLYSNKAELHRREFIVFITHGPEQGFFKICEYCPINAETLNLFEGFKQYIEFAHDGEECCYVIDPTQDNPEIMFLDYEAGEIEGTGMTLRGFLTASRRSQYGDLDHIDFQDS